MDAFVTRAPSAGPSRTRDGVPSKRLAPSDAIPSFFSVNKASEKTSHHHLNKVDNGKGKGRASTEAPSTSKDARNAALYNRAQSVPAAHSSKVSEPVTIDSSVDALKNAL